MTSPVEQTDIPSILTNGMTSMLIGIGFSVGLWDTLKNMDTIFTCETLAKSAQLNTRYVKEWLGSMVGCNIIDVDDEERYSLKINIDQISPYRLGFTALSVFGKKSPDIERVMKSVEPTGYTLSDFPEFMLLMDDMHGVKYSTKWINDNFSTVIQNLPENPKILDFGCGTGIFSGRLADRFPNITIYGIDQSKQAIEHCKKHYHQSNIVFLLNEKSLPSDWTDTFDLVVLLDVLHDLSDPVSVISEIKRVVKKSGLVVSFDPPISSRQHNCKGDQRALELSLFSLMNCLPSSMASPPHAGLGACWGYENKVKFLEDQGCEIVYLSETEKLEKTMVAFRVKQ